MIKTDFMKLYEELTTLTEYSRSHQAQDYLDNGGKPLSVSDVLNMPDWVFAETGVSRETLLATAKHNAQKAAYRNQAKNLEKEESNIVYTPVLGVSDADKRKASKEFWTNAKNNKVDLDNFHMAYDEDLQEYNLLGIFTKEGKLKSKGMYGLIKQYGNDDWCLKAILKFWSIIYNSNGTAYSTKAIELAKANRTWIEIVRDETAELLKQNPVTLHNEKVNSVWAYFDKDKNRLEVSYDFNFGDYRYEVYIEGIEDGITDPKEVAKIILDTLQDKNKGAMYSTGW